MRQLVQACYRPKSAGDASALLELIRVHLPTLRAEGLATEREAVVLRSADGTLIEIFEWKDAAAIEAAHSNPVVAELWERFGRVSEFRTLAQVPEAAQPFGAFELIEL